MRSIATTILHILLLAAAYYGSGLLAQLLAIPPGFATPVWPAAGIALAAVLWGGYRLLPGVFLGSFTLNILIASQSGADIFFPTPLLVGAGIAVGAVLQAALGAWLVRRAVPITNTLVRLNTILSLLLRGGLIACLVNALLGPAVLLQAGLIPPNIYGVSAFTWWVGDVIGVALFTPMLLLLAHKQVSWMRKAVVSLPILTFATIAVFIFFTAKQDQVKNRQHDFDILTRNIAIEFEKDVEVYLSILKANERFINSSNYVSAEEFKTFTAGFLNEHPGIQSLSWNPRVSHKNRDAHEKEIREQKYPEYRIKERISAGKVEPAKHRDEYFPIAYISPYTGNSLAHGFDTASPDKITNNIRIQTLQRARDEKRPITTGRISLVQKEGVYGLIIYHPVYDNSLQGNSVEALRKHLIGYTAGVFIMPTMVSSLQERAGQEGIDIVLTDLSAAQEKQLLYDSRTADFKEPSSPIEIADRTLHSSVNFEVAGHDWKLQFIQQDSKMLANQGWDLWYLLIGGLFFSAIFGIFLLVISANAEAIEREIKRQADEADNDSSSMYLVPSTATALSILCTLILWHQFSQQERTVDKILVNEDITLITSQISEKMNSAIVALQRMAQRWEAAKKTPKNQWRADATHYVEDFSALTTVEWVDSSYHVKWIEPLQGNEKALGLNIAFNEERKNALKGAAQKNKITLTPPLDLVQGYRAIISYIPIHINGQFDGFIVGIYNTDLFLESILTLAQQKLLHIEIKDGNKVVYTNTTPDAFETDMTIRRNLKIYDRNWTIAVTPTAELLDSNHSHLPEIVLLGGVFFSLLLGFAVHSTLLSNRRSQLLARHSEALAASEQRLQLVVDGARDGIWDWPDMEKDEEYWSPQWKALLGYADEEIEAKASTFFSMLHPDDVAMTMKAVDDHIQKGTPFDVEYRLQTRTGDYKWFQAKGKFTLDSTTGTRRMTGSITDIHKRKHAEQELKRVSKKLGIILDNAGEGIYGMNLQGHTTFANNAALDMLGYELEDMLNKQQHDLIHHHHEDGTPYPADECRILASINEGKVQTTAGEVFWKKDGTALPVEYTSRPILDEDGAVIGAVVVFRDITERRLAEQEKEELIERLLESNEELERFAYVASHDLQEPVRMVRNFTSLLGKRYADKLDEDAQKYIDISISSAERMQELIDDLLEYARVGEEQHNLQDVDSAEVIHYVTENLQERIESTGAEIKIGKMPIVSANPVRLSRLLQNLIGNGIKYQKEGSTPKIQVKAEEKGNEWLFSVKDNGIGMKPEYCEQIFLPFKRLHTKQEYQGTGIGLAICRKIVENMGGKLWVESKPGKGSTFYFTVSKASA